MHRVAASPPDRYRLGVLRQRRRQSLQNLLLAEATCLLRRSPSHGITPATYSAVQAKARLGIGEHAQGMLELNGHGRHVGRFPPRYECFQH
jgi:hypothetical protein